MGEQPPDELNANWQLIELERRFDALVVRLDVMEGQMSMIQAFHGALSRDLQKLTEQLEFLMLGLSSS